jgi:hypothetical protein
VQGHDLVPETAFHILDDLVEVRVFVVHTIDEDYPGFI